MKTAICIITILYGLLSFVAPLTQIRDRERRVPVITMLCGGLVLILAAVLKLLNIPGAAVLAAAGALAVCAAAVINGRKNGNIHVSHHIVRFLISCGLTVGILLL